MEGLWHLFRGLNLIKFKIFFSLDFKMAKIHFKARKPWVYSLIETDYMHILVDWLIDWIHVFPECTPRSQTGLLEIRARHVSELCRASLHQEQLIPTAALLNLEPSFDWKFLWQKVHFPFICFLFNHSKFCFCFYAYLGRLFI